MKYNLVGSLGSPFVRMIRLLLIGNKIPFEFKTINYIKDKDDSEFLEQLTPTNKLPVLMIGDQKIYETRVIFNYITEVHRLKRLTLEEENFLSCIQTALDSSANLLFLKMSGLDLETPNWYLARQKKRIPVLLNHLTPWAKNLKAEDWNYPCMALMSYLVWGKSRGILNMDDYPELQIFMSTFKDAPGVLSTDPDNISQ